MHKCPETVLLKGLLVLFPVIIHAQLAMPDSQRYPWNLYLIKNV